MSRQAELAKLGWEVAQRIVRPPKISRINLALTLKCNHKCITCSLWKNNAQAKDLIELSDVDKLIARNHLLWISLTGGEPTLNPYFAEILALASSKVRMVNVITNGSKPELLEKAAKKALINSSLIVIHISLIGNKEYHKKITQIQQSYDEVIECVQRLKSIKNGKLIIGLEHMLSSHNVGQAYFVRSLAKKLGVGLTYVEEQKAGYYNNLTSEVAEAPLPPMDFSGNPVDFFKNTFLFRAKKSKGIKCVAGQYSCTILPNKDVFPCLFAIPDKPAFNLQNTGYYLGAGMMNNQYVKDCMAQRHYCWTPCESYTTVMFRPWRLLS